MRCLMLLRHAKSSWDHRDLEDADRPLAARGRTAAPLLGRYISRHNLMPDLVMCSSARRAQQTWELVSAEWDQTSPQTAQLLEMRSSLYLAGLGEMQTMLRRADNHARTIMIIGHNPGMAQLAMHLVGEGQSKDLRSMAKKFPTAALAIIDLPIEGWSELGRGEGHLRAFVRPKDLA